MDKYLLVSALLILSCLSMSATSFAQDQPRIDSTEENLRWFDRDANTTEKDLLFKALTYTAPDPKVYFVFKVYQDGRVVSWREVINWAAQNSHSARLSSAQVELIKEKLNHIKQPAMPAEAKVGQRYTAFLYLDDAKYTRYNFIGWPIQNEVGDIIELVESELRAQNMR